MISDSTAALTNCREGSAADQQSRGLVSTIFFLGSVFHIHAWFDWVPSKQNPGDPYSRPKTGKKEIAELDSKMNAIHFEPAWPSFSRAHYVADCSPKQEPAKAMVKLQTSGHVGRIGSGTTRGIRLGIAAHR